MKAQTHRVGSVTKSVHLGCCIPPISSTAKSRLFPLLSKVLIHLILLKEVGEEEDCANLTVLWFKRGDSHHLGSLSDFQCNILLSIKLCVCSFPVALIVTSIFAKHNIKILQIQPKAVCYSCNTILTHINIQQALSKGILFFLVLFLLFIYIFFSGDLRMI